MLQHYALSSYALTCALLTGFQGCGLSILRIGYLVPRMCVCVVFSCLAILRIEGCLNSTLQRCSWNPLGAGARERQRHPGGRACARPGHREDRWRPARFCGPRLH